MRYRLFIDSNLTEKFAFQGAYAYKDFRSLVMVLDGNDIIYALVVLNLYTMVVDI